MPRDLRLDRLSVSYPGKPDALRKISLFADPGEFVAVVGPSGSGKSTLLRAVAGLVMPAEGSILVDGEDLVGLGPAQRPTAMVFQTDTLFPDLSIRDNVAFGLTARGGAKGGLEEAVDVALLRFGLTALQQRLPHELSGGQQRRAALARALVMRPEILLLDEPLAGLDDSLRAQLAAMVRDTQRRFGITTLYVTHNQDEALSLPDKLVVLNDGRIEQVGTPQEIYTRPTSLFVASFLGRSNLLDVAVERVGDSEAEVVVFGARRVVPAHPDVIVGEATLMMRPEIMRILPEGPRRSWTEVEADVGVVCEAWYLGSRYDYLIETDAGMVTIAMPPDTDIRLGSGVVIGFDPARAWVLPRK